MRNVYYAAKTLMIVAVLGYLAANFVPINKAFHTWLAAPPHSDGFLAQCYAMQKGKK